MTEKSLKDTPNDITCDWCGRIVEPTEPGFISTVEAEANQGPIFAQAWTCRRCAITAAHSLVLAKEIVQEVQKGGIQLYVGVEKIGELNALVSVKRWSPLGLLESAESAGPPLHTFRLPQE